MASLDVNEETTATKIDPYKTLDSDRLRRHQTIKKPPLPLTCIQIYDVLSRAVPASYPQFLSDVSSTVHTFGHVVAVPVRQPGMVGSNSEECTHPNSWKRGLVLSG